MKLRKNSRVFTWDGEQLSANQIAERVPSLRAHSQIKHSIAAGRNTTEKALAHQPKPRRGALKNLSFGERA